MKYDATATLSIGVTIYHAAATWNTDDSDVASFSSNGTLTGHRPGTTTITATYRDKSATIAVRVSDFAARPSSGSASLAISFRPDPVPGSLTPLHGPLCMGAVPSWSFAIVFNETQGVGFTVKAEVSNWYGEDGRLLKTQTVIADEHYFPANSEFVEETCTDLGESSSGFYEAVLHGIDGKGNELTFRSRLRLLPVAGVSATSSRISATPMAPAAVPRGPQRVW